MKKYKNKYRISSTRLQNWDYGSDAMYFITINTKNRRHYFGEIKDGRMILNALRLTTQLQWEKSKEIRPDMNLTLGEYVIMPDHFHAIIGIGNISERDVTDCIYTKHLKTNTFGPQSKTLGAIVRGFKSSVTMYARTNNIEFGWQPLYHDHVIRDYAEYLQISKYIRNNPDNWHQ